MTVKRKKNLARALSAFASYIDVPNVQLIVTPRGLMVRPGRTKIRKTSRAT